MPSRNTTKTDVPHSYHHVYARGASKQHVFLDRYDYQYFENLFARYLSTKPAHGKLGYAYPHYAGVAELLAYCLMPNHFHMLIFQRDMSAMSGLMSSLMTSYSRYFNLKYERTGSLFESRYKASLINAEDYLMHISRYIHLNPRSWRRYPYSSLRYYLQDDAPEWLVTTKVMELFNNPAEYATFVADYEDHKQMLDELKTDLADV